MNNFDELKKFLGELKPCIICNHESFESWAKLDYFEAKKCINCGMISINPHLNQEALFSHYQGYFEERLDDEEFLKKRWIVYEIDRKWLENFIDHGKVLDIGSSGGQFLSTFDSKRWDRVGVEIENDAVEFAMKNYGIKVEIGNLLDIDFNAKFDLVMMRGVVEHFSEPIFVLEKCGKIIKPGGFLFITATPAGDSFAFEVYKEKWGLFDPVRHIHFFSVKLLTKILEKYGFDLVSHHYQYEETPYANPTKDFKKIKNDIILMHDGKREQIKESVPFPGSMITAIWKKKLD